MKKIAHFIVKFRLLFIIVFLVLAVLGAFLMQKVEVNYNSASYLPNNTETTQGIEIMEDEFGEFGSVKVMVKNLSALDAITFKSEIENIENVASVIWLDDILSVYVGTLQSQYTAYYFGITGQTLTLSENNAIDYLIHLFSLLPETIEEFDINTILLDERLQTDAGYASFINFLSSAGALSTENLATFLQFKEQLSAFYKEQNALYQVAFLKSDYDETTIEAINQIKNLPISTYLSGNSFLTYNNIKVINEETTKALIIAVIIVFILLLVTSTSYFEPIIFLIIIGVGVLINMGTNVLLGDISYLTQSIASILQLALTMDYSIFLLHSFKKEKQKGLSTSEAMENALVKTFSPISASSFTTIASFVALMFMSYTIGFDIGIVLGKGVLISLICVFFLMPGLIVYTNKLIEKTKHKSFEFSFKKFSKFLIKSRFILPIILLLIIVPSIIFSYQNNFVYGGEASSGSAGSIYMTDKLEVQTIFLNQNQLVILLNKENAGQELNLSGAMLNLEGVTSVQSKTLIEASGLSAYLPEFFVAQFNGQNYDRIILNLGVAEEGEQTELLLNNIRSTITTVLGSEAEYYLVGSSSATLEIRDYIEKDYTIVTLVSILLVAIILFITFRSILIPIILIFVIQSSVWINMAIPYFMNDSMIFIGYLIVTAIQLGATIDYAILLTNHYLENRKTTDKFTAIKTALSSSSRAIITSASILCFAGFSVGIVSTMASVSIFGTTIGRGAICSFVLVFTLLPQLLLLLDKWIVKKPKEVTVKNQH